RGSSYLPFTRKRRQQNVIIPKKKKPAENIDGFVSGLKPGDARLFIWRREPPGLSPLLNDLS
ncbi:MULTISPECIES: hypothetical protein, partial [Agrobacterium]|uniref:hypothetical protein n=1 Tax=Agrobacterium TaxID=357 RepID=UPI0019588143